MKNKDLNIKIFNCQTQGFHLKEKFDEYQCQSIVNENLEENGGTLRNKNLAERDDFDWRYFIVVEKNDKAIGFVLIRYCNYDRHQTGFNEYYYVSQIAINKKYQSKGIGSLLIKTLLEKLQLSPLVASVVMTNTKSVGLFSKYMKICSQEKDYYHFCIKNFKKNTLKMN